MTTGIWAAFVVFLCLVGSSLGAVALSRRLHVRYTDEQTHNVIRYVASVFVVMASLILSLMLNAAKNTYENVDHNVHAYATELILLDRAMRHYGAETDALRDNLRQYLRRAMESSTPQTRARSDGESEKLLNAIGDGLMAIQPGDAERRLLKQNAYEQFQRVLRLRWQLVEQSEGSTPAAFFAIVVLWLMLIFASFGHRAPFNLAVVSSFTLASALIAGSIYLILDMNRPFEGPMQVSRQPFARVLADMP
ncbi:MAG: hypothetical protein AB7K04_16315 [Pseudorhodoplanes sp.]